MKKKAERERIEIMMLKDGVRAMWVRRCKRPPRCILCKKPIPMAGFEVPMRQPDGSIVQMVPYRNRYFHSQRCAADMADYLMGMGLVAPDPEFDIDPHIVDGLYVAGPLVVGELEPEG